MSNSYQHSHRDQSDKQHNKGEDSQSTSPSLLSWIFTSIRNLYRIGLLTPKGIFVSLDLFISMAKI